MNPSLKNLYNDSFPYFSFLLIHTWLIWQLLKYSDTGGYLGMNLVWEFSNTWDQSKLFPRSVKQRMVELWRSQQKSRVGTWRQVCRWQQWTSWRSRPWRACSERSQTKTLDLMKCWDNLMINLQSNWERKETFLKQALLCIDEVCQLRANADHKNYTIQSFSSLKKWLKLFFLKMKILYICLTTEQFSSPFLGFLYYPCILILLE